MAHRDIIVIGGSAGALDPLTMVVGGLPQTVDAAILVVVHIAPESTSFMPQILTRSGVLPADFVTEKVKIEHGRIYVAAPDTHLLVEDGYVEASRGPRENGFRPAIDPLFRSVAAAYQDRVIGVILSGALDDGVFGLMTIKESKGVAIVQHPHEAHIPCMPLAAIQNVEVDHIVAAREIASLLQSLIKSPLERTADKQSSTRQPESRDFKLTSVTPDSLLNSPSIFTCPDCGGSLWEVQQGGGFRYRCHTGHGFTPETLLAMQNGRVEHALWEASRVLKERAAMNRKLAERASLRDRGQISERYEERAQAEDSHASLIEELIRRHTALAAEKAHGEQPNRGQVED